MRKIIILRNYILQNKEEVAFFAVLLLAVFCSIFSFLYYFHLGLTMVPSDSKAHLNIARRVIFSLTPGVAQLGGVWLPLPHLLDLLTIWNDFMYYSGLSGSIISMLSYVITALFLFKTVYFYTNKLLSSFLSALIVLLNPSFLFLQTTPMTEPISIALSVIGIYLIVRWSKSNSLGTLILAATITAVSSFARYDNWFLVPASTIVVAVVSLFKNKKINIAESNTVIFLMAAAFGIFTWILYNLLIFSNPLNFATSQGSAAYYAQTQHSPSVHNILISLISFFWVSADNVGVINIGIMLVGLVIYVIKYKFNYKSFAGYLFLAPIVFNIVSLYLGQSIVYTKHFYPYTLYNTRYGINALIGVSFFTGILLSVNKRWFALIAILLIIGYSILFSVQPPFLTESINVENKSSHEAANWVKNHPTSGLTLLSSLSSDSFSFSARIPQQKIIYEGSGVYWKVSLNNPTKYASRIIMGSVEYPNTVPDEVWKKLNNTEVLNKNYHLVYNIVFMKIYDRNK